jgi:hypothetical protein
MLPILPAYSHISIASYFAFAVDAAAMPAESAMPRGMQKAEMRRAVKLIFSPRFRRQDRWPPPSPRAEIRLYFLTHFFRLDIARGQPLIFTIISAAPPPRRPAVLRQITSPGSACPQAGSIAHAAQALRHVRRAGAAPLMREAAA